MWSSLHLANVGNRVAAVAVEAEVGGVPNEEEVVLPTSRPANLAADPNGRSAPSSEASRRLTVSSELLRNAAGSKALVTVGPGEHSENFARTPLHRGRRLIESREQTN
jgi:hypothetical protein